MNVFAFVDEHGADILSEACPGFTFTVARAKWIENFGWKIIPSRGFGEPSQRYHANLYDACKARGWKLIVTREAKDAPRGPRVVPA
jgi:hypothetical protein